MKKIIILITLVISFAFSNNENGWNSLHNAVYNGNIQDIEIALKNNSIQSVTTAGLSPLHIAIKKRDLNIITYLLEIGADINAKDAKGFTPIYYAVVMNHLPIAKLLLERNADTSIPNNIGNTPMHQIAFKNRVEMFELFVQYGAKTDIQNPNGLKPIDFAIEGESKDLILLLLNSRTTN
ncbi:ankyrin repeat domain-containing protein [Arcobacter sp. FWKO B]|uniref:ankyrin repeat domain-containing protein n=1 Tax=Arcobacter sp. FWKO B TaxID=2593672 RepID=UPI0018A40039|nr:ankyrin repeat domain-containing protein [Arcobacter sp. FWKO B]QOG12532.1 ankyrin repeat domain-containing protein [Arcobacter sp. FWKO B]